MKHGLIVPKGFGLVYVYTTNTGERKVHFGAPRENLRVDEFGRSVTFTLFGIFLYSLKAMDDKRAARFGWRVIKPYSGELGDVGTPEGFELEFEQEWKDGKLVFTDKVSIIERNRNRSTFVKRHRDAYRSKLRAINNKAKELMGIGVERAAAIKAAKKCACKH